MLRGAVTRAEGVLPSPPAEIHLVRFGESSIDFELRFWHTPTIANELAITDRVVENVDVALKDASIVIAFPQRDIWMREEVPNPPLEE